MKKVFILAVLVGLVALVSVASAALPTTVMGVASYPNGISYLSFNLKSGGNSALPDSPPLYTGWCINSGAALKNDLPETWNVYSSLGVVPPSIQTENWGAINYVINHQGSYNQYVVQSAIWRFGGSSELDYQYPGHIAPNVTDVNNLVNLGIANEHWVPGPGDLYAVVLFSGANDQPVIIQVPNPPPVPEFPTLGLPVAMLLGMVFTIYVVKRRNEY
jgi:hypothetical protein